MREPIQGPANWRAAQIAASDEWVHAFTPAELAAAICEHMPAFDVRHTPDFRQACARACVRAPARMRVWVRARRALHVFVWHACAIER